MSRLELERRLAASPERVWRALASDELLAWIWPAAWEAEGRVEARAGGSYAIRSASIGMGVTGEFLEVLAPRRLVMTWRWDDETEHSRVEIELEPDGEGSILRLRHEGLADDQRAADHAQGWSDCLDRLPGHLGEDRDAQPS